MILKAFIIYLTLLSMLYYLFYFFSVDTNKERNLYRNCILFSNPSCCLQ